MLIDFRKVREYISKPLNVLHVGAYICRDHYGTDTVTWVEANPQVVSRLKPGSVLNLCISDRKGKTVFNITNNEVSSSLLPLGTHKKYYPHIFVKEQIQVETTTLKEVCQNHQNRFNFLNLDIQGAEMLALEGLGEEINWFTYVYTRVYLDELYEGVPLIDHTDSYMRRYGFERVLTQISEYNWGDAFYIKKPIIDGIAWFGTPHHGVRKSMHVFAEKTNILVRQISSVNDIPEGRQVVLSFAGPFPNEHKGKVLISGPNFHAVDHSGKNIVYNCLSAWNKKIIDNLPDYKTVAVQFPIDYDAIAPDPNIPRDKVIFYGKNRDPNLIQQILSILRQRYGDNLIYFNYNNRYDYNFWLDQLKCAKFCVLVDGSESQGYAVQEAMSTNVPLLVFDCPSWTDLYPYDRDIDKYRPFTQDFQSTSVTIWDDTCGIKTNLEQFEKDLEKMETNYTTFSPRNLILKEHNVWKLIRAYEQIYISLKI